MKQIEKIFETLIINGSLTEQPGLFYGKTGIAVFFFHYAQHTGNTLFQEYAMALIEAIQKQITNTTPTRYDVGIAGIGAGFEYFLQNGFIEAEGSDFFEDFDDRMYRAVMHEPYSGFSLEGSITGWGRYFIYRLQGTGHKHKKLNDALMFIANLLTKKIKLNKVTEKERPDVYRFLLDLTAIPEFKEIFSKPLLQCKAWDSISKPDIRKIFPYLNPLQRLLACQRYFNLDLSDEIRQEWEKWEEADNNALTDMGLLKGWAAEGMLYLTRFHNLDNSWIKLI